jgi:hypothetical protein
LGQRVVKPRMPEPLLNDSSRSRTKWQSFDTVLN